MVWLRLNIKKCVVKIMIKVYSKPKCVQCEMTKKFLEANNVEFEEINIEGNEEALEQIKAIGLKRLQVVIGMKNNSVEFAFSGFQIDLLDKLVQ